MALVFRVLSFLPLRLLHALGAVLGLAAFALSPSYAKRLRSNASLAGLSADQARSAAVHAGRMVLELPHLWLTDRAHFIWQDPSPIDQALAAGQPMVLLTPHLGSFEAAGQAYAKRYGAKHPVTVLFRPPRKAWLRPLVAQARDRQGLRAVPTDLSGVKALLKTLKAGGAVGLLPDQVPPEGLGDWADWWGQAAYTMTLANRLVAQTGAVPIWLWGERLPAGEGFRIHCQAFLSPEKLSTDDGLAHLNAEVARIVAQCPEQYLWGYNRYKKPKAGA
jgi:Kdo2-lipid IVA lauroyltransferase/acyltransferase